MRKIPVVMKNEEDNGKGKDTGGDEELGSRRNLARMKESQFIVVNVIVFFFQDI